MKFVIRPYSNPDWLEKFFPGLDLLGLSICNKPLLEYYLDFLYHLGSKDVLILIPNFQEKIINYQFRGSEWGMKIRVEISMDNESYNSIENRYSAFFADNPYGIIERNIFIYYDQKNETSFKLFKEIDKIIFSPNSVDPYFKVKIIDSIKKYYDLSIDLLLCHDQEFNLSGFGFENGGYVGKGVVIKNEDSISRKVHLGNYVLVHQNSIIKEGSIVGNNVVIESSVEVEKSIIYENAVIGESLFLKNKIVFESKIICPIMEEIVEIDERLLLPLLNRQKYSSILMDKFHLILAILLIFVITPVYLFFRIYSFCCKKNLFVEKYCKDRFGNELILQKVDSDKLGKGTFLYKLSEVFFVPMYSRLLEVVKGRLNLIGITEQASAELKGHNFSSSVFYYSSLCRDPDLRSHKEVFDYFYLLRSSPLLNIYALLKITFSRIIFFIR